MRLYEIDDRTDEIQDILTDRFTYRKGTHIDIINGVVYVDGDIGLKSSKSQSGNKVRLQQLKSDKLPVQFGRISGNFTCHFNTLTSLEGCPEFIGGNFSCDNNKLRDLIGGPNFVNGEYSCVHNPLQTLDGLPEEINGYFSLPFRIKMPILKILFVKGVKGIYFRENNFDRKSHANAVQDILNNHLSGGAKGAIVAAAKLIRAGYKEMARK